MQADKHGRREQIVRYPEYIEVYSNTLKCALKQKKPIIRMLLRKRIMGFELLVMLFFRMMHEYFIRIDFVDFVEVFLSIFQIFRCVDVDENIRFQRVFLQW